ncbi:MAG: exosortase F system-associated protein [Urechidicola sp.]|nr:exosortase F system-associated protein [Urechidicola sp.]
MDNLKQIMIVSALVLLLVLVRAFQLNLFYDPFIDYFKNDFLVGNFPFYDSSKLFLSSLFRYCINMFLSLAIIYVIFKNKQQLFFSIKFYVVAFILLIGFYFFQLNSEFSNGYLLSFYIRRLLIHPVFLLILLPAFYYQKLTEK